VAKKYSRAEIIASSKELFARSTELKNQSQTLIAQGRVEGRPPVQLRRANYDYARPSPVDAADILEGTLQQKTDKNAGELLNSWKEIAAYLKRGVRTLQRWERELDLPVRRSNQRRHSTVMAFKSELDQWLSKVCALALSSQTAVPVLQLPALERRLQQLAAETEMVQSQIRRLQNGGAEAVENRGSVTPEKSR
jgi:hypothetical protein